MTNSPESMYRHGGSGAANNANGAANNANGATTQAFPPVPSAPPAARPQRRGPLSIPLLVAVFALVVAFAGVIVASVALNRGNVATALARSAHNRPAPPPAAPSAAPTDGQLTAAPTDGPLAGIGPSAQFTTAYENESLSIRSHGCDSEEATQVDLDEPRVTNTATEAAELGYAGCSPGSLGSELVFAQVSGPEATPADCIQAIRTNPGQSPVAPSAGLTLCLVTSPEALEDEQKLVLLTVDSVDQEDDGSVLQVTAKAWTVPE